MERRGFSLPELVVGLVVAGIIGLSLTKLLINQGRFYAHQDAVREARSNARASLNLLYTELRMVETAGGVVTADSASVTTRQPYAFGVVCSATAGATVLSLLPVDSVRYAGAALSGYGWRNDTTGTYEYVQGVTISAASVSACAADSVTTLNGGRVVRLAPGVVGLNAGNVAFLYETIRYAFLPSNAVPGTRGLWRANVTTSTAEELVAPFKADAHFRFYVANEDTSRAAPPALLSNLTGLELVLNGISTFPVKGKETRQEFDLTTAIFFRNRQSS